MGKGHTSGVKRIFTALAADRKGATAVEYGLILALVVLCMVVAVIAVGSSSRQMWNNVSTRVAAANG